MDDIDFLVIDCKSPYTALLGRSIIYAFKVIISQPYLKAKFQPLMGLAFAKETKRK